MESRILNEKTFVLRTMPERVGDLAKSSEELAEVATGNEFEGVTGKYFDRSTQYASSSDLAYNVANRKERWTGGNCSDVDTDTDVETLPNVF